MTVRYLVAPYGDRVLPNLIPCEVVHAGCFPDAEIVATVPWDSDHVRTSSCTFGDDVAHVMDDTRDLWTGR